MTLKVSNWVLDRGDTVDLRLYATQYCILLMFLVCRSHWAVTFQRWPLTKNLSSTSAAQLLEHVSTRNAVVSKPARWSQTIVQLYRWYTGCIRAVDGRLLCVRVPFRGPSAGHLRSGRTCKRCTPAVGAATAALTRLSFAAFTFTRLWGRHQSEDSVFSRKSG